MANIHDCLDAAVKGGQLDQTRAAEAGREYDQLLARFEDIMPRHQAEAAALATLKEATSKQARSRRHTVINQLQSMRRLHALISEAPDPALALRDLIEHSETSRFTGESIESLQRAIIKSVNAGIYDALKATGRNLLGESRAPARLRNIIRELHGQDAGDATAKTMAQAFHKQQERLRQLFNAHGGDIGKLDDYGARHTHDAAAIRKAEPGAWETYVFDRVDWSRINDFQTGKPFVAEKGSIPNRERAMQFLADVREGILTKGWDRRDPSMTPGGKALYNRHSESRVLHFLDGDAWMDYNARFGASDPFSSLVGGLQGMARDIAQMRVLGPNPKMGLEYATQVAQKRVAGNVKAETAVAQKAAKARQMLAIVDGSINRTEYEGLARFFANVRNVQTSAKLGAAILSSTTDPAYMRMAAKVVGMSPTNVLSRATDLMFNNATRETAARMGYVAETLADTGAAAARFHSEQMSSEITNRLTGFTIRASGLGHWTDMNKVAFQMEFAGYLAENAARPFDGIEPKLRQALEARGITARDWEHLSAPEARFRTDGGADFLSPIHWREHQTTLPPMEAEGLAMRLQMVIEEQLEYAVPGQRVEGRAFALGGNAPGTLWGEIARSGKQFKGFTLSFMIGQYRRVMALPTAADRFTYAIDLFVPLILMGAVAVQLKELVKGNDPRPMDTDTFWKAAVMQSGGLGIFGDFFASGTNRFGGGPAETLLGPTIGLGSDVLVAGASNISRLSNGEKTYAGRDLTNLARYNTPVLSSLWYQSAAFQHGVADQIQRILDPEAEQLWKRQARKREKDYGTRSWWGSGDLAPSRAPDLSNALGGQR
ncbi:hypothetical protein P775_08455 [Puniceibacterium antarcticum]|uniref:Uncharacterized protein n=1 Tax=Puniceibacterium antarcticum TaxID=1206336 RepID=A0A2G8RGL6_9RHOB|nr:hypothetical protein [Puniceibacterium antarcticum]PIL20551.1 hypothetical protein P775_08455 [Puniceibacterium antarcticum]